MYIAGLGVQHSSSSFVTATTLPTAGVTTVVGGGTKTFVTDCTGLPQGWSSSYSTGSSADVADSIRRFSSITHIPNALSRRAAFFCAQPSSVVVQYAVDEPVALDNSDRSGPSIALGGGTPTCKEEKQSLSTRFENIWLRHAIRAIVESFQGDRKKAAKILGVQKATLSKVLLGREVSHLTRKNLKEAIETLGSENSNVDELTIPSPYGLGIIVKGVIDGFDGNITYAARFFGVRTSTMIRLLEGKGMSGLVSQKIKENVDPELHFEDQVAFTLDEQFVGQLEEAIGSGIKRECVMLRLGLNPLMLHKILKGQDVSPHIRAIVTCRIKNGDHLIPLVDEVVVERFLLTNELYRKLGTLEAVGAHFKVTREAIRGRMERGDALGLFKYNPDRIVPSRRQLMDALKATLSITEASKSLGYSEGVIWRLVRKHNITDEWLGKVRLKLKRHKATEEYMLLCREYGKVLTSTDVDRYDRALYRKIQRYFGGFGAFCEANSIEPQMYLSARVHTPESIRKRVETLGKRREDWERDLLKILDGAAPLSKQQIEDVLGWSEGRTRNLLRSLVDGGSIQKVGRGRSARYAMAPSPD